MSDVSEYEHCFDECDCEEDEGDGLDGWEDYFFDENNVRIIGG